MGDPPIGGVVFKGFLLFWGCSLLCWGCFGTFSGCFGFWKGLFLTILTGIPFWLFSASSGDCLNHDFPFIFLNLYLFPSFLFTIALVIDRKKLAPEAREQTSASESLKMTSKSRLYVSHQFCLL